MLRERKHVFRASKSEYLLVVVYVNSN